YCVPGVRHARVVVSRGLLNTLDAAELDAVLAHEAAHVAGRHDLVIQPFVAWERTFPFLRPAREATAAVSLLVEMLADDAAARETSRRSLARALARLGVARAPVPAGALSIIGHPAAVLPALGAEDPLPATAARSAMQFGGGPGGSPAGGPAGATAAAVAPDAPGLRLGTANPVISRIARLLDPPGVHWWLPAGAYLAAAAVLAAPPVIVLIG
ncbi:M56 family metallopeptidase, partial [Frankia sp. CpI1-P]